MRVLITGGTGFVGTHLTQYLRSRAVEIAVLAWNVPSSSPDAVKRYAVDIRNADGVRAVVREISPTHIYHLAGISVVADSWSNPRLTYEVNVLGAYNLFEAAMSLPSPPRILNVSTAQLYASSLRPLTEDSAIRPENPYAASKAMSELVALPYCKSNGGGIITARAFNHTGPGQATSFVLPRIAEQFAQIRMGKRPPVIRLGNINLKRDFTDVRDVVRAYNMLLDKGKVGETYNVCRGSTIALTEIVEKFQSLAEVRVSIEPDPNMIRSGEADETCGDSSKICAATGWTPQIPLEKTIRDLLDYWQTVCNNGDS
jgi:GDP-4-dehydro-6-deoxy-D-mannose reductase